MRSLVSLIGGPIVNLISGRRSAGGRVRPPLFGRLSRALNRTVIPRHIGTFSAVGLLASTTLYGLILGGHGSDLAKELAEAANLSIREIRIEGQSEVSAAEINTAMARITPGAVMTFDADDARESIEQIGWVASAEVLKLYPNTVRITVTEHEPFALWQRGSHLSVIATDGTELADYIEEEHAGLPLFVGAEANHQAYAVHQLVDAYPDISSQLRAFVFVGQRRWDLILENGTQIRLPKLEPDRALERVAALSQHSPIIDPRVAVVDVRLSDRIVLRRADGEPVGTPETEAGT